jgi:phosphoribosylformylglycinamidine synthase subunit PurS
MAERLKAAVLKTVNGVTRSGVRIPLPPPSHTPSSVSTAVNRDQTPPNATAYNRILMKARVYVSLKTTVLDPQGQAVRAALTGLGHTAIAEVRQGKFFDITIADGLSHEQARKDVETIANEVLANPVIEEYKVEIVE